MAQTKRELAVDILHELFEHQNKVVISDAVAATQKHDISRKTLTRAASELNVKVHLHGPRTWWSLGEES
jgi:hypothetical protein